MKIRKISAALAALMLTFAIAGCGSSSEPAATTAAETTTAAATTAAETTTEATTTTAASTATEATTTTEAETEPEEEPEEDAGDSEGFTLLDVTADLIKAGLYATGENGEELVFSLFSLPDGTPYCSLFMFKDDATKGDVLAGAYSAETETDEDGITYTTLRMEDTYTGKNIKIGFAEAEDEDGNPLGYIIDTKGNMYEAAYLTADETINYMGTAVAFLRQSNQNSGSSSSSEGLSEEELDILRSEFKIGYVGTDKDNYTYYWLVNEDASYGWFTIFSEDQSEVVSFHGDITDNGDGSIELYNKSTGKSDTVNVEGCTDEDGNYYIDLSSPTSGESIALYAVDPNDIISVLFENNG